MCPGCSQASQGLQSSNAPARAPEAPGRFSSLPECTVLFKNSSVLITGPWICSVTVPQSPLALVSSKACHKWQSRDALASQSSVPGCEMAWEHGHGRKGQPVEITGWMRPSRDITEAGATLLGEMIMIRLPVAKPALEASDRFTWAGSHSFGFHFTWHCTQSMLEQLVLSSLALLHLWVGNTLEMT